MKRTYEFMLVLRPTVEATDEKTQDELIAKLLTGQNLKVKKTVQGKKELSYPIQKFTEGLYILVELEGVAVNANTIATSARVSENLLRYLLKRID